MTEDLKERVARLEEDVQGLKGLIQHGPATAEWRGTFGWSKKDPGFDQMIDLGAEYRKAEEDDVDPRHRPSQ